MGKKKSTVKNIVNKVKDVVASKRDDVKKVIMINTINYQGMIYNRNETYKLKDSLLKNFIGSYKEC